MKANAEWATEWVNVQDIKEPIRLLDVKNIYKLNYNGNDGAVFAIRYVGRDKKEQIASFFADFKNNKAGVISIKPYKSGLYYAALFHIGDDFKMKDISEFKTNFEKIKTYADKNDLADCPELFLIKPYSAGEVSIIKAYSNKVFNKVRKKVKLPKNQGEAFVCVHVKINKEGKIETYNIHTSSKEDMFNQTIVQAIKLSEPFDAFPKKYYRDDMWFSLNFICRKMTDEQASGIGSFIGGLILLPLMILGL